MLDHVTPIQQIMVKKSFIAPSSGRVNAPPLTCLEPGEISERTCALHKRRYISYQIVNVKLSESDSLNNNGHHSK